MNLNLDGTKKILNIKKFNIDKPMVNKLCLCLYLQSIINTLKKRDLFKMEELRFLDLSILKNMKEK